MGPHTVSDSRDEMLADRVGARDVYSYGLPLWSMVEQDISEKVKPNVFTNLLSMLVDRTLPGGKRVPRHDDYKLGHRIHPHMIDGLSLQRKYLTNCCYDICTEYRVSKKPITMLRTVIVLCSLLALVRSDFLAQDSFNVENCVAANLTQSSYLSLDRCTPSLNNGSSLRVELNSTNFYNQVNYTTSNTCSGPSVVLGSTQRSDCSSQTVNGVASSLRTVSSSSFTRKPTAQDLVRLKYTSAGCTGAVVEVTVRYNQCQGAASVIACDSNNYKTVCGGDAAIVNPAPGSSAVRLAVYNLAVVVLALALMF
ncbi:hypothetical protein PROFUN_07750 [Planoprotostelium fungivorum]|uniref:Uncharacterized protein n=1 Tax=Planoprotostelium fungivorum TaxID=1890364 RepID=A0A2P6N1G3_9EUKA|nr:hypothetical protein PROFUN_07750 [Planoprotostelium fungivorum]